MAHTLDRKLITLNAHLHEDQLGSMFRPRYLTRMADDPFALFDIWFAQARVSEPNEPNAMAVATVDAERQPSVRMVLMKAHGPTGFVFYTNQQSRKADDITADPKAALLFHWKSLCRQVRIEGPVMTVGDDEADAYFATRDRDSQIGAWASDQSRPLESLAKFDGRFEEMKARFAGKAVPRPPHWSGYRVLPERMEFWEARTHRLHERRLFVRCDEDWTEGLLYP